MDIRQLRYFIAIAEEGQITAAARRLHMAQPPLSQQLKAMEQELGVKLVERTGKQLQMTGAGELFYKHALNIVKLLEESQIEVREQGSGHRGKLSIGVNTLSNEWLPELLSLFQARYPNITYRIQQNESAQLCKLVREREVELAIIRVPLDLQDFHVLPLTREPFCFVTSARHATKPLEAPAALEQLVNEPLIVPSTEGLGLYQMIMDAFTRRGLVPHIVCECSDIHVLLELVASGFGTTLVPESVVKLHRGYEVRSCRLEGAALEASSALIWLKQHYLSQTAQHFIELMREKLGEDRFRN